MLSVNGFDFWAIDEHTRRARGLSRLIRHLDIPGHFFGNQFSHPLAMYISTNIGIQDHGRKGGICHGDFNLQFGKGATLLIGHGIRRNMIGHPILLGAAAGISQLEVNTDLNEEISGVLLFLS